MTSVLDCLKLGSIVYCLYFYWAGKGDLCHLCLGLIPLCVLRAWCRLLGIVGRVTFVPGIHLGRVLLLLGMGTLRGLFLTALFLSSLISHRLRINLIADSYIILNLAIVLIFRP